MAKYSEGTWWDGYEAAKKELKSTNDIAEDAINDFVGNIDEMVIFDIIEGIDLDKSGKVMDYLKSVAKDVINDWYSNEEAKK